MDRLSDYDYNLPEELIAQTPLSERSASRLLHLDRKSGAIEHRRFSDVPSLLQRGDLLVVNDTRVSGVRLMGRLNTGGSAEALLLEEITPDLFRCMVKPAKKLVVGRTVVFEGELSAKVESDDGEGIKLLRFSESKGLREQLETAGSVPLPPYIHERLVDRERYQTVYGIEPGSAAAPTAGLHFTPTILSQLEQNGISIARVTLHVGIDTFRPVQVEDLEHHQMHGERCVVPPDAAERINSCRGRVIAVGTTTVRTLESFATKPRRIEPGERTTKLFIRPGYEFKVVDGMFTNFHLPRTTMMAMISALAGRPQILMAYEEALREKYRFLSFGDSMLIL